MPSLYGLFPTGLRIPSLEEIRDDIEKVLRKKFGPSLPLGDDTLLGFLVGILSERLLLVWEAVEQVNSSQDPDKAVGAALQALALLSGTFKLLSRQSVVTMTMCGDEGTVIPGNSIIATTTTARQFITDDTGEDVILEALPLWAVSTTYSLNDKVANAGFCFIAIAPGISAASGPGPDNADSEDITDNTVHWRPLGEGLAMAECIARSVEFGPIVAQSGDISDILTPAAGWNTAKNLADATLGSFEQTDEELRISRENEVALPGTGTPPAVRAQLLATDGVTNASVFFNVTDAVDDEGLAPHTAEVLVLGGDDDVIRQVLWENVPLGIRTVGTVVGTIFDEEGFEHEIRFSRPEEVPIWVTGTLLKDFLTYSGDSSVSDAIVTYGNLQKVGRNAVSSALSAQCFSSPVVGVYEVTSLLIGLSNPPVSSATIPLTRRQAAVYDSSRTVINSSNGEA